MKNGVTIYGGFPASGDPTLSDRNWQLHSTILSGDINSDGTLSGNSYHVFLNYGLNRTAVLDGFVITGGNDDNLFGIGGAILNISSSPTLISCSFTGNQAHNGGAIHNRVTSTPTLTNRSFTSNKASNGGCIFTNDNSTATLVNCSFINNTASESGGAIFGNISATNCSFQGNSAVITSGAIQGKATLTNSIFWNNGGNLTFAGLITSTYSLFDNINNINISGPGNLTTVTSPFVNTASIALIACSPAINAGTNSAAGLSGIAIDLVGNQRFYSNGIVDMGAVEFEGTPNQQVTITTQPPAGTTFCIGSEVSVPVGVSGTVSSYAWYKNGQSVAGKTTATLSLNSVEAADAGSYVLKIRGACNTVETEGYVLMVDPASAGGTVTGGTTVCTGSNSTQLSLSGQVGQVQKWQSSIDGGNTWTDIANTNTTYTATGLSQTTRYRAVVQSGVCAPSFSEAATVTVGQPPVVDAGSCKTIYLGYGDACATLTASADQPGLSYAWTGGLTGASVQVCPTATTTYTVTATSAAGCQSSASVQVEVLDIRSVDKNGKVRIWVCDGKKSKLKKPEDVAKYLARGYTLGACGLVPCSGQPSPIAVAVATSCNIVYQGYGSGCVTLEAAATGGYGTLRYNWGPGLDGQSVQVCPDKKTKYALTVTDQHGYVATEEVEVEVRDVRCGKDKAGVELCFQGKNLCVSAGEVAGYLAQGARLGKCSDKPCVEEDEDEDDRARIGVAGELSELPVELALEAYPNPTEGRLTLRVRTSYSGAGIVEVLDLTGRAVQSRTAELEAGDNALELDVARQPAGLYILRVRDAAGRQGAVRLLRE